MYQVRRDLKIAGPLGHLHRNRRKGQEIAEYVRTGNQKENHHRDAHGLLKRFRQGPEREPALGGGDHKQHGGTHGAGLGGGEKTAVDASHDQQKDSGCFPYGQQG